jgi:hypothetical protein
MNSSNLPALELPKFFSINPLLCSDPSAFHCPVQSDATRRLQAGTSLSTVGVRLFKLAPTKPCEANHRARTYAADG